MTLAQRSVDRHPDTVEIAQHLIVPESNDAIALLFDHSGSRQINCRFVLPTIDLNHELCSMAGKVRDVMPERDLPAKVPYLKALLEHSPQLPLCIGHSSSETTGSLYGAGRWMTLHGLLISPLPSMGRGWGGVG